MGYVHYDPRTPIGTDVNPGKITGGGGMEMKELLIVISKHPEKMKELENFLEVGSRYCLSS